MLRRNLIANYLGQGWVALMGLAFIPLYIRYLGIEAYGLIGLFAVLQSLLVILDLGMTPTLSREMARFTGGGRDAESIRDLLRSIEAIVFCTAVVLVLGVALASSWLAESWLQAEGISVATLTQAIAIMGVVIGLRFIEGVYRGCLIGLQHQVAFNVINSAMATVRGLGAVAVLAWFSPTIQAYFVWQGLVSLTTLVVLAGATYRSLPLAGRGGRFSVGSLREIWRFAGGMVAITILSVLLSQVDKILLSSLLTLGEYGYYMLAAVAASALLTLIAPISQTWFPRLSQLHAAADETGFVRAYHQGAQLVSVIAGSAAVVLVAFSATILEMWTRDALVAEQAAPILRLLIIGNLLNGLMWMPYQSQLAHRWTGLAIRINLVAVLVIVPAILVITPRYGAEGAAALWVALNAGYVLVGVQFMYRRILRNEKATWYVDDVLKPLSAALAIAIAMRTLLPPDGYDTLTQLGVVALASFLTLGAAAGAAPIVRHEALSIIRRLARR